LRRYITRPAITEQRLSLIGQGNVVVELKSPYDDGTTHVILSPMEFIGRLVSLVPKPKGYGIYWAQRERKLANLYSTNVLANFRYIDH
jgi:hypothetical protein